MGTLSCTISGVSVSVLNASFQVSDVLDSRSTLKLTLVDVAGTAVYTRGQPIVLSDSVYGILFDGFIVKDEPQKLSPDSGATDLLHTITAMDQHYLADKVLNTKNYANWYSGDIALDFIDTTLATEGVSANYAKRTDSTVADWVEGTLSNVVASSNVGDGDLELAKAGSDTTVTVDLSSGTLTNVTYSSGTLAPTLTSTIKLTSTLSNSAGQNAVYVTIWTGSITLATGNTFSCDVWIPSTNKEISATLNFFTADAKYLSDTTYGTAYDQNQIPSYSFIGSVLSDLSTYAENQWYHRTFTIPSGYNGKVVKSIQIGVAGTSSNTFVAYFKNIALAGNTIFSSAFQTTPIVEHVLGGFSTTSTSAIIVQSFDPVAASYISVAASINAVQLVRSSFVEWVAINPDLLSMYASYDGNSYIACTNNSALPTLLAGSNVSGISLYFKALFAAGSSGVDPTLYASISSLVATLQSAPNATKSDVTASYGTQTALNTGTYTNTQGLSNGELALNTYSRNWNDNTITNQTFFISTGTVTNSASTGAYVQSLNASSVAMSRLDFAGTMADFTLDIDVKFSSAAGAALQVGIVYRTLGWIAGFGNTFGYLVSLDSSQIQLGYGSNVNTGTTSYTQIATVSQSLSANTAYHIKIVVNGNSHVIYFNNATTPTINVLDSTYTGPGQFGLRGYNADTSSRTTTWDNLVLNTASTGTWVSPSTSISTLGTCGGSVIAWTEVNTGTAATSSVAVSTSIDGGSSYQACTNGATIPGLTSGTNVSGKSVLVKAVLNTVSQPLAPLINGLYFRILGAWPNPSGYRTTQPLANDTMVRGNVVGGFGTGTDGQTYTKVGTGTVALTSDEATITNTTGDVNMLYDSINATDVDGSVRFSLSASGELAGLVLRYADANNWYQLQANTTTVSIIKKSVGSIATIASVSMALSTNTYYWFHFRVVGPGPINLYGNVWADGTSEPGSYVGNVFVPTWLLTTTD